MKPRDDIPRILGCKVPFETKGRGLVQGEPGLFFVSASSDMAYLSGTMTDKETMLLICGLVALISMAAGAVSVLLYEGRLRRMREHMDGYAQTFGLVETNQRLILEREHLITKANLTELENQRYRKAIASFTQRNKACERELKLVRTESAASKKTIAEMQRKEDRRFGALMRILNDNGFGLKQEDLDLLTP